MLEVNAERLQQGVGLHFCSSSWWGWRVSGVLSCSGIFHSCHLVLKVTLHSSQRAVSLVEGGGEAAPTLVCDVFSADGQVHVLNRAEQHIDNDRWLTFEVGAPALHLLQLLSWTLWKTKQNNWLHFYLVGCWSSCCLAWHLLSKCKVVQLMMTWRGNEAQQRLN